MTPLQEWRTTRDSLILKLAEAKVPQRKIAVGFDLPQSCVSEIVKKYPARGYIGGETGGSKAVARAVAG
jgi:hypothetical protein